MSELLVSGGTPLQGSVAISGSKNAGLAIMSAVVMCAGETILHNVPRISDLYAKIRLLEVFGAKVEWRGDALAIDCSELLKTTPDEEVVKSIRTSFFMLGPLLARLGHIDMAAPGGCKIGARPVDFHLRGLATLGAQIQYEGGVYHATAERLTGGEIYFDVPSAGATQHLMTTAVYAEGSTTIENAAQEPEVVALAGFLNRMGARIEGAGTQTITITGVKELAPCEYTIPADRMQAGTYMIAGAITKGDVTVTGVLPKDLTPVVNKLREAGAEVNEGNDWVQVQAPNGTKGIKVKTMPHPGFPTDMQQPMAALLSVSEGTSVIEETLYEGRFGHIPELNKMGADIRSEGKLAVIQGVERLHGAPVEASDLRAGAALILAGLAADGETTVRNMKYVDRGYENLEENLTALGGKVYRSAEAPL
ncbi:UDP-N-acetylglucosamine 1-carboxyvinyltransferase [bacterium]|nr:MAG: UDP-N-acetylglucosamine 1-carboxyvinyltransferase [bacterium]